MNGLGGSISLIIGLVVAFAGTGGIIFGALRYNRDETGKIVAQQTAIMDNMRSLNDELQEALERTRKERDELRSELAAARLEIAGLRSEVADLHRALRGGSYG